MSAKDSIRAVPALDARLPVPQDARSQYCRSSNDAAWNASVTLAAAIEPLLRIVVPAAVASLEHPGAPESRDAAAGAVRDAATWFLPGVDTSVLAGHELDCRVVGMAFDYELREATAGLPRHRVEAALGALTMLAEDLHVAHSRSIHSSGWIRPMPIGRARAEGRLRGCVQQIIGQAVYALTGDTKGMHRGQARVAGNELDLDGLLALLAEDLVGD